MITIIIITIIILIIMIMITSKALYRGQKSRRGSLSEHLFTRLSTEQRAGDRISTTPRPAQLPNACAGDGQEMIGIWLT